jgi:hypothetical protein
VNAASRPAQQNPSHDISYLSHSIWEFEIWHLIFFSGHERCMAVHAKGRISARLHGFPMQTEPK